MLTSWSASTYSLTTLTPSAFWLHSPKMLVSLFLAHSDAIVSQVLDELGLNLSDELSSKKIQHTHTHRGPFVWYFIIYLHTSVTSLDAHRVVPFRSSEHRGKLVGGRGKETGAPSYPGRRGRRPGGAAEQPAERLKWLFIQTQTYSNLCVLYPFEGLNTCCFGCVYKRCVAFFFVLRWGFFI